MNPRDIFALLKDTVAEWNEDHAPRLGAALAYYTIFSIAPLLIIAVAIAGFVFGRDAAQNELVNQLQGLIGQQGAEAIQTMVANAGRPSAGIIATIIGIVTLLFGASGVFSELQGALNTIWGVEPKPDRGWKGILRDRLLSFLLVLGTGFLLLASLVLSSVLSAIGSYFQTLLPGSNILWQILNFVIALAITTLLFAMLYKLIPDVEVAWSDVWIGALATALLFSIGRFLIGLYLVNSSTTSVYGAAGSLVIVLIWIYYSAQIIFFGAEFTQVYANKYGSHIVPSDNAVPLSSAARAEQGLGPGDAAAEGEPAPQGTESTPQAPQRAGALTSFFIGMLVGLRRQRNKR